MQCKKNNCLYATFKQKALNDQQQSGVQGMQIHGGMSRMQNYQQQSGVQGMQMEDRKRKMQDDQQQSAAKHMKMQNDQPQRVAQDMQMQSMQLSSEVQELPEDLASLDVTSLLFYKTPNDQPQRVAQDMQSMQVGSELQNNEESSLSAQEKLSNSQEDLAGQDLTSFNDPSLD